MIKIKGLLSILKDTAKTSSEKEDEILFVQKLKQYFGHYSEFVPSNSSSSGFSIKHSAGKISYSTGHFLERSKEPLSSNLFDCMQKSSDHFILDLFSGSSLPNGSFENIRVRASNQPFKRFQVSQANAEFASSDNRSLSKAMEILHRVRKYSGRLNVDTQLYNATNIISYDVSLNELVGKIESACPVFVYCMKPNENSFSNQCISDVLLKQVKPKPYLKSTLKKFID